MFGSISGKLLRLDRPDPDGAPLPVRVTFNAGQLFVLRGSRMVAYSLGAGLVREYDVPEFEDTAGVEVVPFGDYIGFSILGFVRRHFCFVFLPLIREGV